MKTNSNTVLRPDGKIILRLGGFFLNQKKKPAWSQVVAKSKFKQLQIYRTRNIFSSSISAEYFLSKQPVFHNHFTKTKEKQQQHEHKGVNA